MSAFAAAALCVGIAACVTDLRTHRIPNVLTFGAAAVAFAAHGYSDGWSGLFAAFGGWGAGAALFLPFFLLGGMGAGDVKLLAALGAWLGPREAFWLAIYASIAGGMVAVLMALGHGYLGTALRNVRGLLTYWWLVGPRPMPGLTLDRGAGAPRVAYALPIFLGTIATIWLQ